MGKIIAIGGGEIRNLETIKIDRYIVASSKKTNPKLLFIPTASQDAEGYMQTMEKIYGDLGCYVSALCLITQQYTLDEIRNKILEADIIYVGGGNTKLMMEVWRKYQVDVVLKEAYQKGIILSGLSAGAICWFLAGHSDSDLMDDSGKSFSWVNGLGIVPYMVCPHYDEQNRKTFDEMIHARVEEGIALEKCTALVYENNSNSIITVSDVYNAYLINKDGKTKLKSKVC